MTATERVREFVASMSLAEKVAQLSFIARTSEATDALASSALEPGCVHVTVEPGEFDVWIGLDSATHIGTILFAE